MKNLWVMLAAGAAAVGFLYGQGFLGLNPGEDRYPIERAAVRAKLSTLDLPAVVFPAEHTRWQVAAERGRVVWHVELEDGPATRFVADLKAENPQSTVVTVRYEGETPDLERRLDSHPALRRAMVAVMRENIAATLEGRRFDPSAALTEGKAAFEEEAASRKTRDGDPNPLR